VGGRKRTDERGRNERESERQRFHHVNSVGEELETVNASPRLPLAVCLLIVARRHQRAVTMIGMKTVAWSLPEKVLLFAVLWLLGLFLWLMATNRGWPTFNLGPGEITLLLLLAFIFLGPPIHDRDHK
jgi:hypothetical protein